MTDFIISKAGNFCSCTSSEKMHPESPQEVFKKIFLRFYPEFHHREMHGTEQFGTFFQKNHPPPRALYPVSTGFFPSICQQPALDLFTLESTFFHRQRPSHLPSPLQWSGFHPFPGPRHPGEYGVAEVRLPFFGHRIL